MRLLPTFALALFVAAAAVPSSAAVKAEKDRKAAADFNLKDAKGKPVKLSDFKGKVVLVNFWATNCGPCRIEIPWFVDMEQRYKDRGFAVLGVAMDEEGWEVIKPYIESKKVNYRILLGTEATAEAYGGVDNLPTTFVIDRNGKIADEHVGLVSKSVYEDAIEQLLSGKTGAGAAVARPTAGAK